MLGLAVLLKKQMRGDKELLQTLFEQHRNMVLTQARQKLPIQEAEDVLYATLERLMPHLDRIRMLSEAQQRAYVYSTARSEITDRLRVRMRERERTADAEPAAIENMADDSVNMDELMAHRDMVQRLRKAVRTLPPEQRCLLEMRYVQELDDAECGRRLGISRAAAKQRLYRLRIQLRRMMEEEGYV